MKYINLTLTSVVFEFWIEDDVMAKLKNLTLTSVVFEFILHVKAKRHFAYLNLTSVVQKNKSYNKENFSMLQLFY